MIPIFLGFDAMKNALTDTTKITKSETAHPMSETRAKQER